MRRGGVVRRGSTWGYRAEISLPGAPRKQVRKSGFRTQAEAQRALNVFLTEADQGQVVPNSRITVEEYLRGWLEGLPARGLRTRTIETYESLIRVHVVPALGPVRMQALSALHLDRLYARLRSGDPREPLSARTVRIVHTVLRRALADAERQGIVPRNVADLASPPSNKSAKAPEATVCESRATERRALSVLSSENTIWPLKFCACWRTCSRPDSRSTSDQRSPQTSPRRSPV